MTVPKTTTSIYARTFTSSLLKLIVGISTCHTDEFNTHRFLSELHSVTLPWEGLAGGKYHSDTI